jgi:PAS domain S-box-containing protein
METLRHLFSSAEFMPHGYCYLWNAKLIRLHVLSDALIFAAYQSIPFMLIYFARQRRHLPYRWMFWLFGAFFVSCGFTHGMEIWTLWHADYWLAGMVKAVTAVASVSTAVLLAKLVPQAARLLSPGAAPEPTAVRPGRADFGRGRHLWLAYGLGVVTTAAVLLVIEALGHEASTNMPVIVFIIPIIFSAYVGGLVPGLISTALSVFVTLYFVLPPTHNMSVSSSSDNVKWMVLTVAGALISVMSEALHRARVRAQADEARLAAIIASAMDAIITVDAGQRIALFNPAAEKMFGYNAADMVGQPHDVLIPERFRSAHAEQIRAFGETHISRRKMGDLGTINGVRADGKEFPVEASISRTELGGQNLFTVIMRDITQRQRDEQTRSYLASIVESSDDAIIGRDLDGTIVSWNPGAQKLYGYSPEEAIGRPGSILVPPGRREELGDTPERVKRGQSIHHYETMRMRKDGQRIQVAVTVSPIKDGEGQVMGSSTITRDVTGQKRAEEELYRSKQMLQLVLDNIPERVFWKDRNFRFRGCNRALLADSGLKSFADVIGKNDFELPWKESARLYRQDDAQVLEAGVPKLDYEEPETYPDGRTRWLRTSKVPLRNQEGKVIGILGTAEDITERRRAEALLQLWTKALEAAANGVVIAGRDGTIVWLNEAVTALTGYSAPELLGRNLRIFKSGKQDAAFYQNLWQTILAGKVWHDEIINRRKDGSLYSEEMTITPVRDSGGSITHFIAIKQDITERKRAEEEIKRLNEGLERRVAERTAELAAANRELEREISDRKMAEKALEDLQQRTELILDSAGDGILGLDLEAKCTFANPAAQRMLGYTRDELIGQDVHRLVRHCLPDGALCDPEECGTRAALKRGVVHQSEDQIIHRKDGVAFPVDQVATPILERGEIVGVVLIFRDVSERRVVEKMKDEFVSVVSHELRTPLTAIRGSLGLLAAGLPSTLEPSRTRRMLEIAVTNTDRLTRLVNDILDAERLAAGHVDLVRADCTASELMLQAADLMRSMAETSGIGLEVKAQSLSLCVNQDSILQVLTNLLSNAIKFSPHGSTVCLEAERDHEVAVFRVTDQGRGIPAEKLESIFGRFQPVDATDTRRRGGTGLGLSICRSIIRRHGGKIWAESEMGRGSTFIFTLPLVAPKGTPLRRES